MNDAEQAEQIRREYQRTFTTAEGQKVLRNMMLRHHCFTPTFNADPHVMAFNEGRRAVVLEICQMVEVDPELFRRMYPAAISDGIVED